MEVPEEQMPSSEAPTSTNEPKGPPETNPETRPDESTDLREMEPDSESGPRSVRGSRWVDYETHELLQMIGELEDERRWARLREGIWIAILLHLALISAITWIPKYVFKVPQVIDPLDAIKNRPDLQYLDLPPDAIERAKPKVVIKPVPEKPTIMDKKTLEALNKATPPPPTPTPEQTQPAPVQPPTPTQPVPPAPQAQLESPRPSAVPARPNFSMTQQSQADQLRQAMQHPQNGGQSNPGSQGASGLARHPGAGTGGVEVLSDRQGVDFNPWLERWHWETEHTWDPLIPDEVNPPILKSGMVAIRFKVLPNGRLMDGSVILEGRSGDTALDRAAWGALVGSNYPPLPREFHGPYLELRAYFLYNMDPGKR
jgi:hypothetical protein